MRISDKTLITISLATSIIGILILVTLQLTTTTPMTSIQEAQQIEDDAYIKINGTITSINHIKNLTIMTISQQCTIQALAFEPLDLATNQKIIATGTTETYKGTKEIILESIILQ